MTRTEAEAIVRGITRTCRGVPKLSDKDRQGYHAIWQRHRAANDVELVLLATRAAETASGIWHPSIENDTDRSWDALEARASTAIFAFTQDCGADVNDVVCAGPFDGKEHERVCPKCGATDVYQAPFFELS